MDLFDSRQLRAFQELAQQRGFTAAARNLSLTQSAVSHSIKALETAVGCPLFERLGKTVRLTAAGEAFLPHVNHILARMHRAQMELEELNRPGHGRLRIGASVTVSQYILPAVLRELRESFPSYDIAIHTDDSRNLMVKLENGEVDVAFGLETSQPERFHFQHLFEDELQLCMSPVHPLAGTGSLRLESLARQDFIFYSRDSETFRLVERWFGEMKIPLRAPLQVGSMAGIKEMARIGLGIGLIAPWIAISELEEGSLTFRPIPFRRLSRTWGLYTDRSRPRRMVDDLFEGICRSIAETIQLRAGARLKDAASSREPH